jgi:protocatechuate 3,4-dioxygenase alpha subunit
MVETWQADGGGRFNHPEDPRGAGDEPGFRAFGRCLTDEAGEYAVLTVKPGRVPAATGEGLQAPHIDVTVFARGLLKHLVTRLYFADEKSNAEDPVLALIEDAHRRGTLVAARTDDGYRFDIRLQGEGETVFFDV